MKTDVWYRTLRCIDFDGKVIGVITVATRPIDYPKDENARFAYGIAYAKAKHFIRKKGQMIAFNRMLQGDVLIKHTGKTVKDTLIDGYIDKTISFVHNAERIV